MLTASLIAERDPDGTDARTERHANSDAHRDIVERDADTSAKRHPDPDAQAEPDCDIRRLALLWALFR